VFFVEELLNGVVAACDLCLANVSSVLNPLLQIVAEANTPIPGHRIVGAISGNHKMKEPSWLNEDLRDAPKRPPGVVGSCRLELQTSCVSSRRSNQTELRARTGEQQRTETEALISPKHELKPAIPLIPLPNSLPCQGSVRVEFLGGRPPLLYKGPVCTFEPMRWALDPLHLGTRKSCVRIEGADVMPAQGTTHQKSVAV
jgi:hypothetical protein